jgi:hypothetical protein
MTLSPQWLAGSIPADLPIVGTGFYASVKLPRRPGREVLICVARRLMALQRGRRRALASDEVDARWFFPAIALTDH